MYDIIFGFIVGLVIIGIVEAVRHIDHWKHKNSYNYKHYTEKYINRVK